MQPSDVAGLAFGVQDVEDYYRYVVDALAQELRFELVQVRFAVNLLNYLKTWFNDLFISLVEQGDAVIVLMSEDYPVSTFTW
jgi:hypothetical protein